jgi:CRISPR-associated endonuclease Csn1
MRNSNNRKYRLGLDLGTNSIGWAAIVLDDNDSPCGVLDMGVRIFPDGRKPTDKTSNAVDRRLARGQRRRRDRYLKRRSTLMDALVEYGLMPPDRDERKALERLDPYKLRACALDGPLSPFELGRSLFHIDQRRGFKSNRKAASDDENEARKTRADISLLRQSIEESGARTLGEFLAWRHDKHEMVRARPDMGLYPDRAMYEVEFDAIRKAQEPHHNLNAEQWDNLQYIIFFQRPLEPVKPGWCQFEYENEERRAAKALPVFQEFRVFQEVNNLRVQVGSEPERPLKEDERERVLQRLRSGNDIKLWEGKDNKPAKPTRDLGLPSGAVFNLAAGGRKAIKGDETTAKLVSSAQPATAKRAAQPALFGPKWLDFSLEERNEIVKFLLDTEDPEAVQRRAKDEWGLDEVRAKAVANVSLAPGYGNLSEKAINKILPHMKSGMQYDKAVKEAGYGHHSDFRNEEAHDSLPYYGQVLPRDAVVGEDPKKDPDKDGETARYGRIPNPTVHIGLNQLRRMVNRLIQAYGRPEQIVVELARDLKMNRKQKQSYERQQREGGMRKERLTENLQSAEVPITSDILRKLRLWEERGSVQARVCPYTGAVISFGMAVSAATEIDHILPFSKTLDDSAANKVVCIAKANRDKGDRSPYEAFGHSPTRLRLPGHSRPSSRIPIQQALALPIKRHAKLRGRRPLPGQTAQRDPLPVTYRAYLSRPPLR